MPEESSAQVCGPRQPDAPSKGGEPDPPARRQMLPALLSGIGFFLLFSPGFSQETVRIETSSRTIDAAEGLRIHIEANQALSNDELAHRLEEAARRLRGEKGTAKGPGTYPHPEADAAAPVAKEAQPTTPATLAADGTPPPVVFAPEPEIPFWARWQGLPGTALFAPPLANPNEPRMYAKATSLDNAHTRNTNDTALGAYVPVLRYSYSDGGRDAVQLDFFGVIFSRLRSTRDLIGIDYRVGVPLTRAKGPWEFKLAYEHTSTHLGDEFIQLTGARYISHIRDEIVAGIAYRFLDVFRAYGQFGYAFNLQTTGPTNRGRYDVGLEWSSPFATTGWGQPYAAIDLEFRGDQNLVANFTTQIGWQWRAYDYGPTFRFGLEYFDGRSPYGQFFLDRESWIGVGLFYGF